MGVWYILQLCPRVPVAQEYINNKLQACLPPHWLTKQNHPWKISRDAWKFTVSKYKTHYQKPPASKRTPFWDAVANTATDQTQCVPGFQSAYHCTMCTTASRCWSTAQRKVGSALISLCFVLCESSEAAS